MAVVMWIDGSDKSIQNVTPHLMPGDDLQVATSCNHEGTAGVGGGGSAFNAQGTVLGSVLENH
jgi:hypothetical protein